MTQRQDLEELARRIRMDCTAIQAKLTELLEGLARLEVVERDPTIRCPRCGMLRDSERLLAEHLYLVHDGPPPSPTPSPTPTPTPSPTPTPAPPPTPPPAPTPTPPPTPTP